MTVKKSITYRNITVAIGVIVALVIALTLWIRVPEKKVSDAAQHSIFPVSASFAKKLVAKTFPLIRFLSENPNPHQGTR